MAKRGRGRPAVYKGNVLKHIVALVKEHNASHAREILNASPRTKLAKQRNLTLVPKALGISLPTLNKYARKAGVAHSQGRPAKAA